MTAQIARRGRVAARRRGLDATPYATTTPPVRTSYNSANYLTTPTPDGTGSATHPDVLYFPAGLHGWKYWMAMTPFKGSVDAKENPSILVGQDGVTWQVPPGLTNPIDPAPTPFLNSDTDLLYGEDGLLYCFYREASTTDATHGDIVKCRSSTDGAVWSAETTALSVGQNLCLSPTVFWAGTQYVMMSVKDTSGAGTAWTLEKRTSTTPTGPWSAPTACAVDFGGRASSPWHIDAWVDEGNGRWYMWLNEKPNLSLSLAVSRDSGATWTASRVLIDENPSGWDNNEIYRATGEFTATRNAMRCWYSAKDTAADWWIGYTEIPASEAPDYAGPTGALVYDGFNRPNSTTGIGTPDTGTAPTVFTAGAVWGISNHAAYSVSNTGQSTVGWEAGTTDVDVSVTLAALSNSGTGLCFRAVDDANNYVVESSNATIFKRVGGTFTSIGSAAVAFAQGDVMRVLAVGSSIKLFRNGTEILSVTDTALSGTKHGLRASVNTGTRFDRLTIMPVA